MFVDEEGRSKLQSNI